MYIVARGSVQGPSRKRRKHRCPVPIRGPGIELISWSAGSGAAVAERTGTQLRDTIEVAGAADLEVHGGTVEVRDAADLGRGGVVAALAVAHLRARLLGRGGHLAEDLHQAAPGEGAAPQVTGEVTDPLGVVRDPPVAVE